MGIHPQSSIFHPRPSYLKPNRSNVPSFSISSRKRRSISCCAVTCLARGSVLAISSRVAWIAIGLMSSPRLQHFHLRGVCGVENFPVGEADFLGHQSKSQVAVRDHDLIGLGHHVHELADHLRPLGDDRAQRNEAGGHVGGFDLAAVDDVVKPLKAARVSCGVVSEAASTAPVASAKKVSGAPPV